MNQRDRELPPRPESEVPLPSPPRVPSDTVRATLPSTMPPQSSTPAPNPYQDLEYLMDRVVQRALAVQGGSFRESVEQLGKTIDKMASQTDLILTEVQRHSRRITELETELDNTKGRVSTVKAELDSTKERLSALERRFDEFQAARAPQV